MKILNHQQIKRKVRRLALQILENNFDAQDLYIGGINKSGQRFAEMLILELSQQSNISVVNFQISLSPAAPLSQPVRYSLEQKALSQKHVIIVDDVANTGRTLFYATKPLMDVVPDKLEMAVLVDRKHKSFPVYVDYVGLSLATTLGEKIHVRLQDEQAYEAELN